MRRKFSVEEQEFIDEAKNFLRTMFSEFGSISYDFDEESFVFTKNSCGSYAETKFTLDFEDNSLDLDICFLVERKNCEIDSFLVLSLYMPHYTFGYKTIAVYGKLSVYFWYLLFFYLIDLYGRRVYEDNEYLKSSKHLHLLEYVTKQIKLLI